MPSILAKFSHKSSKMADVMEDMQKHIHRMNATRWNSELLLVKSIVSIGKTDLNLMSSMAGNSTRFSDNEFVVLKEIIDILDPFQEISVQCQAETAVTASLVVPSVVHLLTHLRDILNSLKFCAKFAQQLEHSLEKRFSGIINRLNFAEVNPNDGFNDPVYFVATVLDPAFKFFWIRDLKMPLSAENRLKQQIVQMIIDEINKDSVCSQNMSRVFNSSTSSNSVTSTPMRKRRKLFIYDESSVDSFDESKPMGPDAEIDAYINDPVRARFTDYWLHSQLPLLRKLVLRIFTIQASSAPIERAFSQAGLLISPKRTRIGESLFRSLVFLRVNHKLLP